jgi:hypothetical protein
VLIVINGVSAILKAFKETKMTAVLMNRMAVDPRGQDTATVVIAVGTGTTNLALGKPAPIT